MRADDAQVTVWPTPNGLPIASTTSPTSSRSESPNGKSGEAARFDLEQRDVGLRIGADQARRIGAPVVERHLDLGGVGDDVAVGQDVAARGVDDHAGARALPSRARHLRQIEEAPEERVVEQRIGGALDPGAHRDVDHAGRHAGEQRRHGEYAARGVQERPRGGRRHAGGRRARRVPRARRDEDGIWHPASRARSASAPMVLLRTIIVPSPMPSRFTTSIAARACARPCASDMERHVSFAQRGSEDPLAASLVHCRLQSAHRDRCVDDAGLAPTVGQARACR